MAHAGYDCIVLGVGGFGSGALYHLARRGARVLGIDQYGMAHDRGSSHGETRIIRKAYFEHADYVPLLQHAYLLWRELESETARQLLHQVGLFIAGLPECESVSGTLAAARQHNLPVERLLPHEAARRFRGYRFPEEFSIVYESEAGYLEVENCVAAHSRAAQARGAELRWNEPVLGWKSDGSEICVTTTQGRYYASRLIIAAGPWASRALAAENAGPVGSPWPELLRVVRKPVFWFSAPDEFDVAAGNSTFFFETPAGQFYGFPRLDGQTIKLAEHTGGASVADPATVDRSIYPDDLERVTQFASRHLPQIAAQPARHSMCLYTKTPDSHFIVDRHPQFANVVIAAGFSGHGFKFTSVLGQALADLAADGHTPLPVGFLSLERFRKNPAPRDTAK
jgi:sarcosine oxidase